jgi:hypothetical protein
MRPVRVNPKQGGNLKTVGSEAEFLSWRDEETVLGLP